jgi:hypothetical protein
MELPAGLTCGHCVHVRRCCTMFGHTPTDTYCDWFPRRFVSGVVFSRDALDTEASDA